MKRFVDVVRWQGTDWAVFIEETAEPPVLHVDETTYPHQRGRISLTGKAARDWNATPIPDFLTRHLRQTTFRTWDDKTHVHSYG